MKGSGINVVDDLSWPEDREEDLVWLNAVINSYKNSVEDFQNERKKIGLNIAKCSKEEKQHYLDYSNKLLNKIIILNTTIKGLEEGAFSLFKRYRPEEITACSFEASSLHPIKFVYPIEEKTIGAYELGKALLTVL